MDTLTPGKYKVSTEVEILGNDGPHFVEVRNSLSGQVRFMHTAGYNFELILPDEPPVNAVVIDCDGDPWARHEDTWSLANTDPRETTLYWERKWGDIQNYGPLKVVYTP